MGTIALLETLDDSEKTLSEMVGELPKTWNSPSFHLHCDDEIKYEVLDGLIQRVRDDARDGLTFG